MEARKLLTIPAVKGLTLKSFRSIIGLEMRNSTIPNPTSIARPSTIIATSIRVQPSRAPSVRPTRKRESPPPKRTLPAGSIFSCLTVPSSRSLRCPEGCERAYRQVDPEDRLPAQADGQDPAEDETYHGAADACDEVDPDGLSSLCCWEGVCDDGNVVGPDEGRAYSLDEAEAYEHATAL